VLQEAGLVLIHKGYDRKRPLTTCRLTSEGRERFVDYLSVLERVVRDAAKATDKHKGKEGARNSPAIRSA
jgi:hypothetical protein